MPKYIQKIGTPHYYPYTDKLAAKTGFVVVKELPSVADRYFGGEVKEEVVEIVPEEVVNEVAIREPVAETDERPVEQTAGKAGGRRPETKQVGAVSRGK